MSNIHTIIRNIKNRNDLEMNLLDYAGVISGDAYRLAGMNLAMNHLTLAETICETVEDEDKIAGLTNVYDAGLAAIYREFHEALTDYYVARKPVSAAQIEALRNRNRDAMKLLADAVDLYVICEYVLNRVEHQFHGAKKVPSDYSDLSFTQDILAFIAGKRDEAQNLALISICEQLPVRMTKNKFYDLVRERLSVYKESDLESFRSMVELLAATFCLNEAGAENPVYAGLYDLYHEMSHSEIKAMTAAQYADYQNRLALATAELNANMDLANLMQTALNGFQAVLLTESSAGNTPEEKAVDRIMRASAVLLTKDADAEELLAQAYSSCEALEGAVEEAQEAYTVDSAFTETIMNQYVNAATGAQVREALDELAALDILLSNSTFAEHKADESIGSGEVTDEQFEQEVQTLLSRLAAHFDGMDKAFVRAAMARFQSVLPPRFLSQEDVEMYIYESLRSCTVDSEKLGCIDIISELMKE